MDRCARCSAVADKQCATCGKPYCGLVCQKKDWQTHQTICGRMEGEKAKILLVNPDPNNVTLAGYCQALPLLLETKLPGTQILCVDNGSVPAGYDPDVILVLDYMIGMRPDPSTETVDLVEKFSQTYNNVVILYLQRAAVPGVLKMTYDNDDIARDNGGFNLLVGTKRPLSLRLLVNNNKLTDGPQNTRNLTILQNHMEQSGLF